MTNEQFQQLIGILGQVGGDAYQAALVRALVYNVIALFVNGGFLLAVLVLGRKAFAWMRKQEIDEHVDHSNASIIKVLIFSIGCFASWLLITWSAENVIAIASPQFEAIKLLTRLVVQ